MNKAKKRPVKDLLDDMEKQDAHFASRVKQYEQIVTVSAHIKELQEKSGLGWCADKTVFAELTTPSGAKFYGFNGCANPQTKCPRSSGEGYTKCREICRQPAHAEVMAISQWDDAGAEMGATMRVWGANKICCNCKAVCAENGVIVELVRGE
ncbi:hypothetical protein LVJ82_00695 [Vitreoscilla massiliensis]|uniref:Uncharacterized protein n=1 Tax=Vitreoscilla massiliensis TaxID=1689272 RepID=A0ABY4E2H9_9NEIS|nr:hypothetical protein [Vitreoscilla massiliensis]UOO89533.1 hypothetical protein LVJ82_00695 [Vitreoscilla massiliensis]